MTVNDLYVWAAPKDVDDERARELVADWLDTGGDPALSPFEPSTDIGWFFRELKHDHPDVDAVTDANPMITNKPVWLSGGDPDQPAGRVVGIRFSESTLEDLVETVFGLPVKYDLMVFDAAGGRVRRPQQQMSNYARATFWPAGAIRTVVAGLIGIALAVGGWVLGIPIIGWLLVLVGGFLFVLCAVTLVAEARKRLQAGQAR